MEKKPEKDQFLLAEYSTLREEIVKRIELEYQIINLTLVAFSAICGFALSAKLPIVVLLYPILCVFLASAWVNSDFSILYMAQYIKNQIETKIAEDTTGWEHFLAPKKPQVLSTLSVGGTFVITSLFAIGIGISLATFDLIEIIVLISSVIGLIYTITLLVWYHFKRKNSTTIPIKNEERD